AGPIDVRVGRATQPEVAAHVDVPCPQVGVHVVVVTVGLIRHTLRRTEVDPTRDGSTCLVIEHRHVDPVPAVPEDIHTDAFVRGRARLQLRPPEVADFLTVVADGDPRGGHRGDLDVGARALRVVIVAPAATRVREVSSHIVRGETVGV